MAAVAPSVARAQIPVAPAPAPAAAPAPTPPPPAAPDAGPAPAEPAKVPPGDEYFVEQPPPAPPAAAPQEPPPFEPPLPGASFEPPPPPQIRHLAPQNALVLGARIGWFFPFGNVWAKAKPVAPAGSGYVLQGVPWSDYAASGPMFELNAGVRLSRAYTAFALWERAQLRSGGNDSGIDGAQDGAETDFWAVGLRASSNPDALGFLTEVAVGYRRARTFFKNDVQYQFTDAPFEARLGLGGELRLNRMTSVSSLVTIGVGGFGSVERVGPSGTALPLTHGLDDGDGHAWATLTIGGHFDLIGSKK
jgi:hypothetical protein